jgi:hypothetical protein
MQQAQRGEPCHAARALVCGCVGRARIVAHPTSCCERCGGALQGILRVSGRGQGCPSKDRCLLCVLLTCTHESGSLCTVCVWGGSGARPCTGINRWGKGWGSQAAAHEVQPAKPNCAGAGAGSVQVAACHGERLPYMQLHCSRACQQQGLSLLRTTNQLGAIHSNPGRA